MKLPAPAFWLLASIFAFWLPASDSWRDALPGYRFAFPRDHASHPDYKIEWWYYTGNLASSDGRRFGYQLTFFRVGVDSRPSNPSIWTVRDLFMAHAAISDINGGRYLCSERFNRAGPGWAGAAGDAYHVWNEGWEVRLDPQGRHLLHADDGRFGLDLVLEPGKPPVFQGESGFSRKGSRPGNASLYYSLTRMPTSGILTLDGRRVPVSGSSWMDHEFGTSFLEEDQSGWDWLSLQLDDGTELMVFQLRKTDGTIDRHSSGTFVDIHGGVTRLGSDKFQMSAVSDAWQSSAGRTQYPTRWRVRVDGLGVDLAAGAALPGQEFRGDQSGISYWEGSVEATGTRNGRPIHGRGYLEMTGYAGPPMGTLFR